MLDKSGSLQYGGYAQRAEHELLAALEDRKWDENAGLVLFNHESLYVKEIAPLTDEDHVQHMVEAIRAIPAEGYTDFDHAFSAAYDLIRKGDRHVWTQIILLTDGIGNSDEINAGALTSLNVTVHGVALNDTGDLPELQELVSETGGKVVRIQDLHQLTAPIVTVRDVWPQCAMLLGLTVVSIGLGIWLMMGGSGPNAESKADAKKVAVTPQERKTSNDKQ